MRLLLLRELRLLLLSPSGAALLAVWTFLTGALFLVELSAFEQAQQRALQVGDPALLAMIDLNDLLLAAVSNHLVIVLLFLGPLLGGRVWSDGPARAWLLHAAPSPATLVAAKLAAGVIAVGALVVVTLGLPLFLSAVAKEEGAVDVAQALLGSFTVWAAGSCFFVFSAAVAVRVQVPLVAALGSFLLLTVLWLLPNAGALAGPDVAAAAAFLSPSSHVERGLRGVVSLSDLLWFAGLIAGGAVATFVAVNSEREGR